MNSSFPGARHVGYGLGVANIGNSGGVIRNTDRSIMGAGIHGSDW